MILNFHVFKNYGNTGKIVKFDRSETNTIEIEDSAGIFSLIFWYALGAYIGGIVLYLLFTYIYYKVRATADLRARATADLPALRTQQLI